MHHSRYAGDTSLATVEGIALFVMQTEGIVALPRPGWLPAIVRWTRTTTGATYYGLQMRGDGLVEPMGPELAAMLAEAVAAAAR